MMKFKASRKMVMANYHTVIEVGYCGVQFLLRHKNPIAYTSGVYGWNSDIYDMGKGVAIVTGYRPFGNVHPNYDIVNSFEEKAKNICDNVPYEERSGVLDILINGFIKEVTK